MNKVLYTYNLCLFSINITNSNKTFFRHLYNSDDDSDFCKIFCSITSFFFFFFGGDLKANDLKTGLTFVNKTS